MKAIMKRAWEISREAVKNFGGKAMQYMSEALKMAWAEVKKATVKEWFERKIFNENFCTNFDLFCGIKETEKAVYAMCFVGMSNSGKARKKCMWIPKSVIENINSLKMIPDYDKASYAFDFMYI